MILMTFIIQILLEDCAVGASSAQCASYKGREISTKLGQRRLRRAACDPHARRNSSRMRPHCRWQADAYTLQARSNDVGATLMVSDATRLASLRSLASDIDSQAGIADAMDHRRSLRARRNAADRSRITLLPDCSCDDGAARRKLTAASCDLRPQKKFLSSAIPCSPERSDDT
ncbi:hypothetical protein [Bradyrhizobium sp. SRS-191]|uniref:hypothetical protein n=1 Tax=Bradyrhizobium sp. SRS-191 TaxID=2962606 RepID=UPI00211DE6B3|nr:hypothetical protein [Bradyrhizobium sp. SRS-191]